MKKFSLHILGTLLLFPVFASKALGVSIDDFRDDVFRPDNLPGGRQTNAPAETKIAETFEFGTSLLLYASGSVAVFMLVFGGVRLILSFGNQEQMDAAKNTIKWAVIGLLIVILAFALVQNVIDLIFSATT